MMNPLLADWTTPFGIPPFDSIKDAHFAPAFEAVFAEARARIAGIADNPAKPTFANTIEALELADKGLERVLCVFFNRAATDLNDALRGLQRDVSTEIAAFNSEVSMNAALFRRIDTLQEQRDDLGLTAEQKRVLDLYHRDFVRNGAKLAGADRDRLRDIQQELAQLGTAFTQNMQTDEETWSMTLGEGDLDGLPDFVRSSAKAAAQERGTDGYVITLSRSLIVPFLQFSTRRDLRETAYRAWIARGENGGDTDNREIVRQILSLRHDRAQLLGYENFAAFKLHPQMAQTPKAVRDLLMQVWQPAKARAEADAGRLQALMQKDGVNDTLRAWDWRYYATILQKQDHDLDDAELKPYLQLDNIIEAAFDCADRLFGLRFVPLDAPVPHPDAHIWEVRKGDRHLGVFIGDYFARASKRSGAWCSSFRSQHKLDGEVRPIAINVCNFAKPAQGEPALLTMDDAHTLFHEMGHALHVLLSDVSHPYISGTSVARDFVELPSQLYEHWLTVPEVLAKHARHADTDQPMPDDLMQRVKAAENFDQGFATVEYVASALVDLAFHDGPPSADPMAQQAEILSELGMPAAISMRHATPHFQHVFSGDGYSSGYYSYMWSEVMDADAFAAFKESGDVFDTDTAERLEKSIYSAGGSRPADETYVTFRGKLPTVDALLQQRGLID
ncbi:M3 family metallopeptidase [Halovulum sp. GXIMD14793]